MGTAVSLSNVRWRYNQLAAILIFADTINDSITWQGFPQNSTGKYANYNMISWYLIHKLPTYHVTGLAVSSEGRFLPWKNPVSSVLEEICFFHFFQCFGRNLSLPVFFEFFLCFILHTKANDSPLDREKMLTTGCFGKIQSTLRHGLSQDLETGCPKLAIVKFLGVQIFKGDHNILRFQP